MPHRILSLLLFIIATQGAPVASNTASAQCYTDSFEDRQSSTPETNPVLNYNGVHYQNWDGDTSATSGSTGGIVPHSPTGDAVTTVNQDLTAGHVVTLNPFGTISAQATKYFGLYSFWFGCSVAKGTPAIPTTQGCTLSVTGVDGNGKTLPSAIYSFSPASVLSAPMVQAVLPASYAKILNVTIAVTTASVSPVDAVLVIDDVYHCNFN